MMYLGTDGLHQVVVDLLQSYGPRPIRSSIEYLRREWVGEEVLLVLRNARSEAGIGNPAFDGLPEYVALLSCYSRHLADGLLQKIPVDKLPPVLKGFRLEHDLGM